MSKPYYQHPLFGLILYVFSHVLGISYLIWMLIGNIGTVPAQYQWIFGYFPPQKYRVILPMTVLGGVFLYFFVIWLLRQVKRREEKEFIQSKHDK